MHWNHRIVVQHNEYLGEVETTYHFKEVYYENDGTPTSYSDPFMCGDNLEELQSLVNRLQTALSHPVLDDSIFKKD
jgi:hypothetical protein